MKINTLRLITGARQATGLTVIIDVFRAFSLECYLTAQGASSILAVADVDHAFHLKATHPEYILMGERGMKKLPGFDYGNSPALIEHIDFTAKTIVHTTSAGTQGIMNAVHASEIVTGSLVNAQAIVRYIETRQPDTLSLVCMGNAGIEPADEDELCAEYIKGLLLGNPPDEQEIVDILRRGRGAGFFEPDHADYAPPGDFYLCTRFNAFDFVLKAEKLDEKTAKITPQGL